jgi:tetratricopeptide (TPR) repeat protein
MKHPISLTALTFLFSATLVSSPIISADKTIVQAQEAKLGSAQAYIDRGHDYHKLALEQLAIADYSQAIKIDPNNSFAYYYRGLVYAVQGKHELAKTDLKKAKQLNLAQGDAAKAEVIDRILRDLP